MEIIFELTIYEIIRIFSRYGYRNGYNYEVYGSINLMTIIYMDIIAVIVILPDWG